MLFRSGGGGAFGVDGAAAGGAGGAPFFATASPAAPTKPRTVPTATVVPSAMSVLINVPDDGDGISDDHLTTVFERFRRLDEGRAADEGGSGLGLAIVADLVRAHHGTVVAQSCPRGARFVVTIPALTTT